MTGPCSICGARAPVVRRFAARARSPVVALAALLGVGHGATGCDAPSGYLLRQAWGQLKVLHGRRPIREVLARHDLSAEKRAKLTLVLLARQYGQEEIGLRTTAAYTKFYDTGGAPLAYNLTACPKDRLRPVTWAFPIVGELPYIGFFDRRRGEEEQRKLEARGLDTYLYPIRAFSSLGWFADPVYSPMLEGEEARLVDLVLHETTHTTVFFRGQVAFNESLATFVGNQGTLDLLARLYGPTSAPVKQHAQSIVRRRRVALIVGELYTELERLYASGRPRGEILTRREQLFARAQARYKEAYPDPSTWGSFVREPLNNAVVLSHGRYNRGIEFHARVYEALGRDLRRLVELYRLAQRFDDPVAYVATKSGVGPFHAQRM